MDRNEFRHELKFVNGRSGDPAVNLFFPATGSSLLFDLGKIDQLSNRELLRIRHVFVSHTHIDHFIGFDRLLRVNIPHRRPVSIYGPEGFIDNVSARIRGFTWNLLEPGQLQFHVREILAGGRARQALLSNDNGFLPEPEEVKDCRGCDGLHVIDGLPDGSRMMAVPLDHGTPSVAYRLQGVERWRVNAAAVESSGYTPGSWIRDLQAAANSRRAGEKINPGDGPVPAEDLAKRFLESRPPFSIGYVTDVAFSDRNLQALRVLLKDSVGLVCEAAFRDEHRDRAVGKLHLTTRQAALIAALCGVDRLHVFHFSAIYGEDQDSSLQEAEAFFTRFRGLPAGELAGEVEAELQRCAALSKEKG